MALQFSLDPKRPDPLYRQLYSELARQIESGDLAQGYRLPATRELAGQLGLNRTTVSAAYELLESDGLISGQVGRGSFVLGRRAERAGPDWASLIRTRSPASVSTQNSASISFATSRPPDDLFPVEAFQRSVEEVLAGAGMAQILQLGSPLGYEPLRQYLIAHSKEHGALGPDDDVMVTNGCQQALDLLARVLVRPGQTVAIEDPVYPGMRNIFREAGAELAALECPAKLIVVTPSFQNPTGATMPLPARKALLNRAMESGAVVIENDIYSELRYHGPELLSLKQITPDAGTVLIRSFSKIAFPGLRLGWVIAPRPLIGAIREMKQMTDLHSDQFSQAVMLRFAESGRLAAHKQRMLDAGRERLEAALSGCAEFLPRGSRWTRPEGGFNLWVTLPDGIDTDTALETALRESINYAPGSFFGVIRRHSSSFRLSYAAVEPATIRRGLQILSRVFEMHLARRTAELEPAPAMV